MVLSDLGNLQESQELLQRVVNISGRVLGEEHPETLTAQSNLVLTLRNQSKFAEAEALSLKIIEVRRRRFGEENPPRLTWREPTTTSASSTKPKVC
jgi:hypothetical protein